MVQWESSLPEASVGIVWTVSFIAVLWRYAGPAKQGTPDFLIGTGVALAVLQVFAALILLLFKWVRNPPFGFLWVYLSLVLTGLVVHVGVLGADLARITLSSESVPYNTIEYDIAIVVCQTIYLAGVFCLAFGAGSHSHPPPWAHRDRPGSNRATREGSGAQGLGSAFALGETDYAAAGTDDGVTHTIGLADNDEPGNVQ
jgi:hypothetical protein